MFVELQGYRRWGMVHLSQLSNHLEVSRDASDEQKMEEIKGVVSEGESLWVKVVEVRYAFRRSPLLRSVATAHSCEHQHHMPAPHMPAPL